MKRYLHTTIILLIFHSFVFSSWITAQVSPGERLRAERVAFFTEKLQLTSQEAEKFWPVFNDYDNRKDKLNNEKRTLALYIERNSDNMSQQEITENLNRYMKIQEEEYELGKEFHEKFLAILSPRKVLKLYVAENQFRQHLLERLKEQRRERLDRRF